MSGSTFKSVPNTLCESLCFSCAITTTSSYIDASSMNKSLVIPLAFPDINVFTRAPTKHNYLIRLWDPDSNTIQSILFGLLWLPLKHDLHGISTEFGMKFDFIEWNSKHNCSICCNLDSYSSVIECRFELLNDDFMRHQMVEAYKFAEFALS